MIAGRLILMNQFDYAKSQRWLATWLTGSG
jgi:hypothetical protein